jgi:hypothetical protein
MQTPVENAQRWLEDIPVLAELSNSDEQIAVQSLIGHEGFRLFLGLMLGSRQAKYLQLSKVPLANSADATRAAVIQGTIAGIEMSRETVLECFQPLGSRTEGAQ